MKIHKLTVLGKQLVDLFMLLERFGRETDRLNRNRTSIP